MKQKKTLVLGASLKPDRYSHLAVQRLVNHQFEVVAFGLKSGKIEGVKIDTKLLPYKNVHTVTLYVNVDNQKMYYDYIVSLKPERVIFNPGTENPEFYKILEENDIFYEVACSLVLLSTNQY
ncbi:CoA-binding protein [Yeosuana marina]|uniref:CoA-binding protein n=1 Tax=Yeosuana marina TaxID=1565536 RepID=UPI0030C7E820|tara:strand:- start:955 stop:1320 length:366 start_codon:yes stop_codon:yes gene_type:complete